MAIVNVNGINLKIIKELQKVQNIFISSLFKKNKNYLGIYRFKILGKYTKKKGCCFRWYKDGEIELFKRR